MKQDTTKIRKLSNHKNHSMSSKKQIILKKGDTNMTNIDYKKYNDMTTRQLQKAYNNSVKKIVDLESKMKIFCDLVNFLSSKIQKNIANEYRSIINQEKIKK